MKLIDNNLFTRPIAVAMSTNAESFFPPGLKGITHQLYLLA